MGKGLQRTVLAILFLLGLAVFCFPYAQGFLVKREMASTVQTFQEQKETQPTTSVVIPDSTQPTEQRQYADLPGDTQGTAHQFPHHRPGTGLRHSQRKVCR